MSRIFDLLASRYFRCTILLAAGFVSFSSNAWSGSMGHAIRDLGLFRPHEQADSGDSGLQYDENLAAIDADKNDSKFLAVTFTIGFTTLSFEFAPDETKSDALATLANEFVAVGVSALSNSLPIEPKHIESAVNFSEVKFSLGTTWSRNISSRSCSELCEVIISQDTVPSDNYYYQMKLVGRGTISKYQATNTILSNAKISIYLRKRPTSGDERVWKAVTILEKKVLVTAFTKLLVDEYTVYLKDRATLIANERIIYK